MRVHPDDLAWARANPDALRRPLRARIGDDTYDAHDTRAPAAERGPGAAKSDLPGNGLRPRRAGKLPTQFEVAPTRAKVRAAVHEIVRPAERAPDLLLRHAELDIPDSSAHADKRVALGSRARTRSRQHSCDNGKPELSHGFADSDRPRGLSFRVGRAAAAVGAVRGAV
jgi:hypothetical protein